MTVGRKTGQCAAVERRVRPDDAVCFDLPPAPFISHSSTAQEHTQRRAY